MLVLFKTLFQQSAFFGYMCRVSMGFVLITFASMANASSLKAPEGPVLLTIDGNISNVNVGDTAQFDLGAFKALGLSTIETKTPWTEGKIKFVGVYLSVLLNAVGSKGKTVSAKALDGYVSEFSIDIVAKYKPLLAFKADGKILNRRGKGPLWILFAFDDYDAAVRERISNYSVWQLNGISIKD